ncbi:serine/threonine protein kinase ppk15, putative [Entamoeba invadens IP1]|uniref:Serine/threonine protein kinase ppk15, putative n=1 Tax=Entamoeba invadens IP1 TaxID=370355 RepID=A0A0A1UBJ0_ENTIV|nr:serine/threonine protein kinase ppk15, putative [Entamoeba invadens IP1]ELP91037.1 serine/threonine protein kinase ppk15, putative [Entamoeba invadens IP1]|eukprot:XP_004257808.1 serine/threonine protein kinase ppk15, putative [Entamoeba invadens IP1]
MSTIQHTPVLKQETPNFEILSKVPLTLPDTPNDNSGEDNDESHYIVYKDMLIGSSFSKEGNSCAFLPDTQYRVISLLGKGVFGQVFKCVDLSTGATVALKILKNRPSLFRQGMLEIAMLTCASRGGGTTPNHVVKIVDHFLYNRHVCIVFELLGKSLYEVERHYRSKSVGLNFTTKVAYQILKALFTFQKEQIIHCDLKPENILLEGEDMAHPIVKVIDVGSACFEGNTIAPYIQSRHYRAPEVILGLECSTAIDMWSFGCIVAELLLGIPIFPGENEFNQIYKIIEMIGTPSEELLKKGVKTSNFFRVMKRREEFRYMLMTPREYAYVSNSRYAESKRYHKYKNLKEFCEGVELMNKDEKSDWEKESEEIQKQQSEKESEERKLIFDFLSKIFVFEADKRMSPFEAAQHPLLRKYYEKDKEFWRAGFEKQNDGIEKNVPMEKVITRVFGKSQSTQEIQNQCFDFKNYYMIYTTALWNGIVLSSTTANPFHCKPLRFQIREPKIVKSEKEKKDYIK